LGTSCESGSGSCKHIYSCLILLKTELITNTSIVAGVHIHPSKLLSYLGGIFGFFSLSQPVCQQHVDEILVAFSSVKIVPLLLQISLIVAGFQPKSMKILKIRYQVCNGHGGPKKVKQCPFDHNKSWTTFYLLMFSIFQ